MYAASSDEDLGDERKYDTDASNDSGSSGDGIPIILGYDSSLQEYEARATDKVRALLVALEEKMYRDGNVTSCHTTPALSPASSPPPNMFALVRRHNFETHNRPQVASLKVQPKEWTARFPYIRVRGLSMGAFAAHDDLASDSPGWSAVPPSPSVASLPPPDSPSQPPTPTRRDAVNAAIGSVLPWAGLAASGCGGLVVNGHTAARRAVADADDTGDVLYSHGDVELDAIDCQHDGPSLSRSLRGLADLCSEVSPAVDESLVPDDPHDPHALATCTHTLHQFVFDSVWSAGTARLRPLVDALVHETYTEVALLTGGLASSRNRTFTVTMPTFIEEDSVDLEDDDGTTLSTVGSTLRSVATDSTHVPSGGQPSTRESGTSTLISPVVTTKRTGSSSHHPSSNRSPITIPPELRVSPVGTRGGPSRDSSSSPTGGLDSTIARAGVKFTLIPSPDVPIVPTTVIGPRDGGGSPSLDDTALAGQSRTQRRARQGRLRLLVSESDADGVFRPPTGKASTPTLTVSPSHKRLDSTGSPRLQPTPRRTPKAARKRYTGDARLGLRSPTASVGFSTIAPLALGAIKPHTTTAVAGSTHQAWTNAVSPRLAPLKRVQSSAVMTSSANNDAPRAIEPVVVPMVSPRQPRSSVPVPPLQDHGPPTTVQAARVPSRGASDGQSADGFRARTALPRLRGPLTAAGDIVSGTTIAPLPRAAAPHAPYHPTRVSPRTNKLQAAGASVLAVSPRSLAQLGSKRNVARPPSRK